MTAIIICNGSIIDYSYYSKYFKLAELIICVDGGALHARKFGVLPDILLGDFDSISQEDLNFYKDSNVEIIEFPSKKDMTDTELAIEIAAEKGCNSIILIGALGTRMDHSLSNIFILKRLLDKGIQGYVVNENNEMTIIKEKIQLMKEQDVKISLLPLTDKVSGVTTEGLYYPLDDATIDIGSSRGVSNEYVKDLAEVRLSEGYLLVIKARD